MASVALAAAPAAAAYIGGASLLLSLLLTGAVRHMALHRQLLDTPNARSSHSTPTPRGGGAAIVLALCASAAAAAWLGYVESRHFVVLIGGTAAVAMIGWLDDIRGLSVGTRLLAQAAVAVWAVAMLQGLPLIRTGAGSIALGPIGYPVAVLGIMWSINLVNFMDGIDGLVGSQAALILAAAAALLMASGATSLGLLSLVAAAAAAGFLPWNWPPARIFLGDVGSGAIGFLVATLAIASENAGSVPLLVFAILGAVLISDATVTLLRRLAHGHRPAEAHRQHAYQRLSRAWNSHRAVSAAAALTTTVLVIPAAIGTVRPSALLVVFCVTFTVQAAALWAVERRWSMWS
jgi:Fuc2NAc and GlcNAc transferase